MVRCYHSLDVYVLGMGWVSWWLWLVRVGANGGVRGVVVGGVAKQVSQGVGIGSARTVYRCRARDSVSVRSLSCTQVVLVWLAFQAFLERVLPGEYIAGVSALWYAGVHGMRVQGGVVHRLPPGTPLFSMCCVYNCGAVSAILWTLPWCITHMCLPPADIVQDTPQPFVCG